MQMVKNGGNRNDAATCYSELYITIVGYINIYESAPIRTECILNDKLTHQETFAKC